MPSRIVPVARVSPHDGLLCPARSAAPALARSGKAEAGFSRENVTRASRRSSAGRRCRPKRKLLSRRSTKRTKSCRIQSVACTICLVWKASRPRRRVVHVPAEIAEVFQTVADRSQEADRVAQKAAAATNPLSRSLIQASSCRLAPGLTKRLRRCFVCDAERTPNFEQLSDSFGGSIGDRSGRAAQSLSPLLVPHAVDRATGGKANSAGAC